MTKYNVTPDVGRGSTRVIIGVTKSDLGLVWDEDIPIKSKEEQLK